MATFKTVTSLSQLADKWLNYAVSRTGVALPNCFTYSTARISQVVGKQQSLDGNKRVAGAGDLWETHASEFRQSSTPIPGALAIFKGRTYGHVANVEVVGVNMMITESNYGNYGSGYFRCVEMRKTPGTAHPADSQMILKGFLIHKDLEKKTTTGQKIGYQVHGEDYGWQVAKYDGATAGTTGKSKRMEAIKFFTFDGTIVQKVEAHMQNINGWKTYNYPGANTIIGTTGESRRLEALKIKTSQDCIARVHIQDKGWTDWMQCDGKNVFGTTGKSLRLEAIQMKRGTVQKKTESVTKAVATVTTPSGLIAENGVAILTTDGVRIRRDGVNGQTVKVANAGFTQTYTHKFVGNGHRYVVWNASGIWYYMAISGSEKQGVDLWATFLDVSKSNTTVKTDMTIVSPSEAKQYGLTMENQLISSAKYPTKSPYSMTPTRVVVHNSGTPNANAQALASNIVNTNDYRSWHFSVDETKAIQSIPLNRNGFHAGDGGNGVGNRQGIAIEIARDMEGNTARADKAQDNGALLVAILLKKYGWGIDKVTKHQDYQNKYCPHRILDNGWDKFLKQVQGHLAKM